MKHPNFLVTILMIVYIQKIPNSKAPFNVIIL